MISFPKLCLRTPCLKLPYDNTDVRLNENVRNEINEDDKYIYLT